MTELPVVGGVVEVVHSLLTDLSIPLWIAESIELGGLLLLTYVFLRLLFGRLLPWLVTVVEPVVEWLFDRVAMILLMPELAVTRIRARMGKPPFAAAYSYGDGVITLARVATSVTRTVLGVLPRLRQIPKTVPAALAVLLALAWNNATCAPAGPAGSCVSPATHWLTEADQWFVEQSS